MKRLIDEPGLEGTEQRLADLFRAAAPFEADPFRKRRVLVSLSRVRSHHAPRFWFRPLIAAALLVSGTAAAALGHRYVTHGTGFLGFGSAAPTAAPKHKPEPRRTSFRPVTAAAQSSAKPAADAGNAAEPQSEAAPSMWRTTAKSSGHTRLESSEDAKAVVAAIQALRTGRDPSRAQALLTEYLKTHPNGVLSEDALALSIEAASTQHDPRAADYARRYLAKFPQGKYQALASRAVAQQR